MQNIITTTETKFRIKCSDILRTVYLLKDRQAQIVHLIYGMCQTI